MGCVCLGRRARSAGQGLPQPRSRPVHHLVPGEPKALPLRTDEGGRRPGTTERPRRVDGPRAESRGGLPGRALAEREVRPDRDRLPLHRRPGGRLLLHVLRRLHARHRCGRRGRGRTQRLGRGDAGLCDVGHLRLHAHRGSGGGDGHDRRPCTARGGPCPMGRDRDGDRSSQAERSLGRSQPARSTRLPSQLLWDPGFHARGAAILEPASGAAVRGTLDVRGKAWQPNPFVHFYVDDVWISGSQGTPNGNFTVAWSSNDWSAGAHRLRVVVQAMDDGELVTRAGEETPVVVDRTPPILELIRPAKGDLVRGLAVMEAGAHDDRGLAAVVFRVDGIPVEIRHEEPFTFFYETTNLVPGTHAFGVRSVDRAGNEAVRDVDVRVGVSLEGVPLPCTPVCNLRSTASSGNLPPLAAGKAPMFVPLAGGDRLEVVEAFRAPWVTRVDRTDLGVSLVLDPARNRTLPESAGLVGSRFGLEDFGRVGHWRIVVRDHGSGDAGVVRAARILIAARTSPAALDTDLDGVADGLERSAMGTIPVLPDVDADGLLDGVEIAPHPVTFTIDGMSSVRTVRTNPIDFDTDDDRLPDGAGMI